MYTRRTIRWRVILHFAWLPLLLFTLWATIVTVAYVRLKAQGVDISLPMTPLNTIGVAVAFYIGFKNNQSYDRYWEARKIWGGIVNVSRSWANQVRTYVTNRARAEGISAEQLFEEHRTLIYRHLAWINALRFQLRRKTPFGLKAEGAKAAYMQTTDVGAMRAELTRFLPSDEVGLVCDQVNSATHILDRQGQHLRRLSDDRLIDAFREVSLMDSLTECFTLQGKCERIKNTPFPRQYAHFSNVFTWIFVTLVPFGLLGEFGQTNEMAAWLCVPLSTVIAWIFVTMETVGDTSEDPFENFMNDVPMSALCRTIEIDLRQMLGETDIPPKLEPIDDVLM